MIEYLKRQGLLTVVHIIENSNSFQDGCGNQLKIDIYSKYVTYTKYKEEILKLYCLNVLFEVW